MAKFGIQELATILVNKGGLSNDEAVSFVNAFFDLIQEGMNIDEIVKVKGLGTFKLVNVEARESVNVNTGERVLIDSHAKISFTPDTTMKDIVNKPFSSFETVMLNEGVTFDDMNPVVATESDIESEDAAEYETEVYTEPEAPEAPVEEVETPTEEIVTSDTVDETAIEEPQQVEQQEEKHDNLRNGNTAKNLWQCLVAVFYLAAHLSVHTLRQFDVFLHHAGNRFFNRSGIDTLCKLGRHRDAAFATTMHDATLAPLGLHLGNLSQRHGCIGTVQSSGYHRSWRCNTKIGHIREGHIRIVFHHDG
jgi:nucleoid DNA-binding protein